jgi:hypothetical protein
MESTRQKEILQQAFRLSEGVDHRTVAIAAAVHCSKSLVGAWRTAQRPIFPEQAQKLAEYLFKKNVERQRWLVRALSQAKDPEKMTLLKELDQENRELRIGSTSRDGYGRGGLLDQFMARFFRLSGIKYRFIERDEMADLKMQLVQGELDVGIGIFATLDRSLQIKFYTLPVRVGLNAIVLEETLRRTGLSITDGNRRDTLGARRSLRQILAPEALEGFPEPDLNIVPVVVRTDVGGIYAMKTLGFTESDVEFAADHHYSSYAEKLLEEERRYSDTGLSKAPVAIVDDISALYVLRSLDKKKAGARLVFPLSNPRSASQEKKWMPEYLVGISVKRTNEDLVDYLRDALRLFLRTEIQMISSLYTEACLQMESLATEFCNFNRSWKGSTTGEPAGLQPNDSQNNARTWAEYTFGLSEAQLNFHQDFELPWKPILQFSRGAYARQERPAGSKIAARRLRGGENAKRHTNIDRGS